ncbi:MAG: prefoldin subunit beta [Candidatus Helarchaeota archaeon]
MAQPNISPQLQNQIVELQQLQQRYELLMQQKGTLDKNVREITKAIDELEKLDDNAAVYKSLGSILLRADKNALKEELIEKKETFEMRLKTIQRQEDRTKKAFEEKRALVQNALSAQMGNDAGGNLNLGPM